MTDKPKSSNIFIYISIFHFISILTKNQYCTLLPVIKPLETHSPNKTDENQLKHLKNKPIYKYTSSITGLGYL